MITLLQIIGSIALVGVGGAAIAYATEWMCNMERREDC